MRLRAKAAYLLILLVGIGLLTVEAGCREKGTVAPAARTAKASQKAHADTVAKPRKLAEREKTQFGYLRVRIDSLEDVNSPDRYKGLTEEDFRLVADELGVEVAAMKAVVSIEAGTSMKGFWAPGIPIINFDRTMYNKYRSKAPSTAGAKGEKVPEGLTGYGLRQWTQLINARKTNAQGANMGTFWGMFQIGGFNYKLCGCTSVDEFVKLMAFSELEQLELFAAFILNAGMVDDLKAKRWAAFARKYNGPSYASRGYHTKMAAAYARFKK